VSSIPDPATLDDPELREALKRCSPATYFAACKFRQTGDTTHLPAIITGVVERYVERELRPKLREADASLRLREDLGLDSLTMMEIVMLAEEVLRISISNEELTHLKTLADVGRFFEAKLREITQPAAAFSPSSHERVTNSRLPMAGPAATATPAGGLAG
jgi:3-hydroxyacyl-[acyl-carrier-protein] dehydratase